MPETAGFSARRLQRIEDMLLRHIQEQRLAGSVTLVARKGQIIHLAAHGLRDVESKQCMTAKTRFRMASSTKPVTAAGVLLLVEQGRIRLSDPVYRFLPEFEKMKVATERRGKVELITATRPITIHDLLTHTSGLGSDGIGAKQASAKTLEPHGRDTLARYARRLATVPLDFQPGTQWSYSGIAGFDLLAHIIELASGQSFPAFLRQCIFEPLGMTHTAFLHQPADDSDTIAAVHQPAKSGMEKIESALRFPKGYYSGAGGLISTAEDFFRFLQMLAGGGELEGERLLSPRTVELFTANHVGALYKEGLGFGLGVEVVIDPARADTFRSTGSHAWYGAYGTYAWVDPKENLVGILLQQSISNPAVEEILRDFETAVMQALVEPASSLY